MNPTETIIAPLALAAWMELLRRKDELHWRLLAKHNPAELVEYQALVRISRVAVESLGKPLTRRDSQ